MVSEECLRDQFSSEPIWTGSVKVWFPMAVWSVCSLSIFSHLPHHHQKMSDDEAHNQTFEAVSFFGLSYKIPSHFNIGCLRCFLDLSHAMFCPSQERSRCYQGCSSYYYIHFYIQPCTLGRPCKIIDMSTSKTGKHGHAKVHLVAIDVRLLLSLSQSFSIYPNLSLRSSLQRNMSVPYTDTLIWN